MEIRSLNEGMPSGIQRGGLPLDDSFDQAGTFLKQQYLIAIPILVPTTVSNPLLPPYPTLPGSCSPPPFPFLQPPAVLERVDALVSTLPQLSPSSAWRLYTTTPGLLVWPTLQVAQHLTGLAHAAGLNKQVGSEGWQWVKDRRGGGQVRVRGGSLVQATVEYCCTCLYFCCHVLPVHQQLDRLNLATGWGPAASCTVFVPHPLRRAYTPMRHQISHRVGPPLHCLCTAAGYC